MSYIKKDVSNKVAASVDKITVCWSCHGPRPGDALFCPTCECVQPPSQEGPFARLGFEATFDIDVEQLDCRYFDRQRLLHPDRFIGNSAREKAFSQQQAASLNEAYEALKQPLSRAGCLLHERGCDILHEGCNLVTDETLLVESMEMREALAEAETVDQVKTLARRAENDINACIDQLSLSFIDDDVEMSCRLVTRLKYLNKLKDEARQCRVKMEMS